MQKEVWKDIPTYGGYYKISSLGNVKSNDRTIIDKNNRTIHYKGKVMAKTPHPNGYLVVRLSYKNRVRTEKIHQLVAIAFLGHNPNGSTFVIDHKDENKKNNSLCNLRIVSNRFNVSKSKKLKGCSSNYFGVSWCKSAMKWNAKIMIKGKRISLGYFDVELEAAKAYEKELNKCF